MRLMSELEMLTSSITSMSWSGKYANSDINLINKLRYWLNQMLQKTEDGVMSLTQTKSLDSAQKGIKRNLEDLLSRDRLTQEKIGIPSGQQFR